MKMCLLLFFLYQKTFLLWLIKLPMSSFCIEASSSNHFIHIQGQREQVQKHLNTIQMGARVGTIGERSLTVTGNVRRDV